MYLKNQLNNYYNKVDNCMGFENFEGRNLPHQEVDEKKQEELDQSLLGKLEVREITMADRPIQRTLFRLNIIGRQHFPEANLKSVDSCSGHVDEKGCLQERTEEFFRELDAKVYYYPSYTFEANGRRELIHNIRNFFGNIFKTAVENTNSTLGYEALGYREHSEQVEKSRKLWEISFEFDLDEKGRDNAFLVLKTFHGNVEKELEKVDGSQEKVTLDIEDFLHH
jgi:hypothetical protein